MHLTECDLVWGGGLTNFVPAENEIAKPIKESLKFSCAKYAVFITMKFFITRFLYLLNFDFINSWKFHKAAFVASLKIQYYLLR